MCLRTPLPGPRAAFGFIKDNLERSCSQAAVCPCADSVWVLSSFTGIIGKQIALSRGWRPAPRRRGRGARHLRRCCLPVPAAALGRPGSCSPPQSSGPCSAAGTRVPTGARQPPRHGPGECSPDRGAGVGGKGMGRAGGTLRSGRTRGSSSRPAQTLSRSPWRAVRRPKPRLGEGRGSQANPNSEGGSRLGYTDAPRCVRCALPGAPSSQQTGQHWPTPPKKRGGQWATLTQQTGNKILERPRGSLKGCSLQVGKSS